MSIDQQLGGQGRIYDLMTRASSETRFDGDSIQRAVFTNALIIKSLS